MWSDIVKQNREHLMVLLKEWISEMEDLYDIQFLAEMQARFKTILRMRKNTVTLYR